MKKPALNRAAFWPRLLCVLCLVSASLDGLVAKSAIVSTSGSVMLISPPASVGFQQLEDDAAAKVFAEQINLSLASSIDVEVTAVGLVDDANDLTPGSIPAGTRVDSYLLHADKIGGGAPIHTYGGSVTFDRPILGVIVTGSGLSATDGVLASASTTYDPIGMFRGFDGPSFSPSSPAVGDSVEISPDFLTATIVLRTETFYDQIRIITAAVPEPTSWMVCVIGLPYFGWGGGKSEQRQRNF
jgi:hypothetical protein